MYVFAVSALAAFLTIVAFIKPDVCSSISQATITVPREMSQVGLDPLVERIRSIAFLRRVAQRHGIADGDSSSHSVSIVDDWAQAVQAALHLEEQSSTAANAVDIVLKYCGLDGDHSIAVMESLLDVSCEEALNTGSTILTPEAQLRKTAADQQLERAKDAQQRFVDEELTRLRQEHRVTIESQIPVSIKRDAVSAERELALPAPLGVQEADVQLNPTASDTRDAAPSDWLSEQKRIDEGNDLVRNPEFDVLVRALVRAQAERQELLTQFSVSHSAVRRVEVEIQKLELLVSHTEKYLHDDADEATSAESHREVLSLEDETLVSRTDDFVEGFDESAALVSIRQSETYQSFEREIQRAEQELATIAEPTGTASNRQPVVVSQPPELLNRTLVGLAWPKLLTITAISTLLGFVVSRLGDAAAVPTVFYSIADVHRSLRIPVVGQLAMDNTPVVPQPESITRGRFWQQFVRAGELAALLLIGGFTFASFLRPEIFGELFSNPVTAYVHALYELRTHVPVPYLFQ